MVKVIADTSFLMLPGTLKINIVAEVERLLDTRCELLIPTSVLEELKNLVEKGTPKERSAARLGLKIAERFEKIGAEGRADESIVNLAMRTGGPVGTADRGLRKKLREMGISVIYARGKSHLELEGKVGGA